MISKKALRDLRTARTQMKRFADTGDVRYATPAQRGAGAWARADIERMDRALALVESERD